MATNQNDDLIDYTSSEHVIMSEGLSIDLGEEYSLEQSLKIDEASFVCTVRRAKITKPSGESPEWELELEVPGLSLVDLLEFDRIVLHYNNVQFCALSEIEFDNNSIAGPIITFNAERILNTHE